MSLEWEAKKDMNAILTNSDKTLYVPDFQRNYDWNSDNINDFLDDLQDYIDNPHDEDDGYLFGQIILQKDGNKTYIIDGQQRIVTSTIFLFVTKRIIERLKEENVDKEIKEEMNRKWFEIEKIIGYEKKGFKLKMSGKNTNFFYEAIQKEYNPNARGIKYSTNKLLIQAYNEISRKIEKKLLNKTISEQYVSLDKYLNTFLNHFYVTLVTTNNLQQALTIFETLNSRGKDLDESVLIKIHLIQLLGKEIIDEWDKLSTDISDCKGSLTNYIRCVWNSTHDYSKKKQLYRSISLCLGDEISAKAFFEDLLNLKDTYISLIKPDNNDESTPMMRKCFSCLKSFNVVIHHPLIISAKKTKATDNEINQLSSRVESLLIRNMIIGNGAPNTYEPLLSRLSLEITQGTKTIENVISEIKKITNNDVSFKESFMDYSPNSSNSKAMLREIYNEENRDIVVTTGITDEHIMPVTLSEDWKILEKDHETYVDYLGNRTLLLNADNSKCNNKSFDEKKKMYYKSSLPQNNSYFVSIEEWNIDQIIIRQNSLFDTAKNRWISPDSN